MRLAVGLITIELPALDFRHGQFGWGARRRSRRRSSRRRLRRRSSCCRGVGGTLGALWLDVPLSAPNLGPLARKESAAGADTVTRRLVDSLTAARDQSALFTYHRTVILDLVADIGGFGVSTLCRQRDARRLAYPPASALHSLVINTSVSDGRVDTPTHFSAGTAILAIGNWDAGLRRAGVFAHLAGDSGTRGGGGSSGAACGSIEAGRLAYPSAATLVTFVVRAAAEAAAHACACSHRAVSNFGAGLRSAGVFADLAGDSVARGSGGSSGAACGSIEAGRFPNPLAHAPVSLIVGAVSEALTRLQVCSCGAVSDLRAGSTRV